MVHCFMDFETKSAIDIKKCGAFRYIEDESFGVLLLAYAFDDAPVRVVDFASGETWPEEFLQALRDPAVTKVAHNAIFERTVIGKLLGYTPPEEWLDTMHLAAQCGLPLSLDAIGKALGLPEDQAKMREGKALIRYFCQPCKPTKSNGGRTWNLPEHAPEKWDTFKAYCTRDVEAERTILHTLERWMPSPEERRFWCLDARINERGVRIDRKMAQFAVAMDQRSKEELTAKAVALTGLENPKSVSQVKTWLADQEGKEFPSLNKKVVADVVASLTSDASREFMALRSELSKSSTAKYEAMLRSVCKDDHVRGTFQFYGANRTGRFCLTGDHEVLTPSGWVPLESWRGGRIAVWSPTSRALSFQDAQAVSFPYEGDLLAITHQRCEQLSTPEHKMPVLSKTGVWEGREMQEVFGKRFSIPFTGTRGVTTPTEHNALRVLIMVQADGHFSIEGDLKLGFKKLRKVERCKHLLRKAGISFVLREFQHGVLQFTIRRQDQPLWLREFRDKTFGWWMLDEDSRIVVDELEYWDAYRCGPNSIQYTTTNRQNAEVLQAVCALGGYSATLLKKARGADTPNWNDSYILNIWLTPGDSTSVRAEQQMKKHFNGTVYCAVTPTGYFLTRRAGKYWITGNSGRLVQYQNLPQNHMEDLDEARQLVRGGHYTALKALYDGVSQPLSELIRTALIPEPGHQFLVADFSAIEARVIAWMAGERWRLDAFREGADIYCASASQAFHVPVVKHGINGHLRQKGKIMELACGYGGGVGAMKAFGADKLGMTEEEMQETVDLWRESSPRICEFWRSLEKAAVRSVVRRAHTVSEIGGIGFDMEQGVLWMTLPSGRRIAYWGAKYEESSRNPGRKVLSYMGQNQQTKKWERIETWGGKLVENCWTAGTPVLTHRGWVPIEDVSGVDLVWDGVEWVPTNGSAVRYSRRPLFELDGLCVTGEHKILTERGWVNAADCDGLDRAQVQLPGDSGPQYGHGFSWAPEVECQVCMWAGKTDGYPGYQGAGEKKPSDFMRLQAGRIYRCGPTDSRDVKAPSLWGLAFHGAALYRADAPSLEKLRWARHHGLRAVAAQLREFLGRHGPHLFPRSRAGSKGKRKGVFPRELPLGDTKAEHPQSAKIQVCRVRGAEGECFGTGRETGDKLHHTPVSAGTRLSCRSSGRCSGRKEPVYDVLNCGPRHRYVVLGKSGPIIAHNCVQATARDCLREAMFALDAAGFDIRAHVHDEVIVTEPLGGRSVEEMAALMGGPIPWAPGLPLRADGYACPYYQKD